ncbi:uncharacterized protein LOC112691679 [Sipha flava]|uniref:Uncharacterized protein LOC112691679 n=1 Tax=Sipha flava TaxID=143950 RepID=A0A8B8GG23_9HEMI|nr:uncharacterized protein LOC112691679 [Sipha flava]
MNIKKYVMNTPVGYFCRYSGNNRARNFNTAPRPGILLIQSNRQIGPAQNIAMEDTSQRGTEELVPKTEHCCGNYEKKIDISLGGKRIRRSQAFITEGLEHFLVLP